MGFAVDFDWRHYIRIEGVGERDLETGALVLTQKNQAYLITRPSAESQIMAQLKQQEIIDAELDVASRLPGFREDLINGSVLAHGRLEEAKDLFGVEPPEDMRLVLEVGSSSDKTEFFSYDNRIVFSPYSLVKLNYIGDDSKEHPLTLLQAIVHEVGHYGDPKFSAEFEHTMRNQAYEKAVARLLKDFPERAEEYQQNRTIAGIDFSKIEQAKNFDVFDIELKATLGLDVISPYTPKDGETLRSAYERKFKSWEGDDVPQVVVQQYFRTVYNEEFKAIDEREMEYPIIDRTYAILSAVDPDLTKRAEYKAVKNDSLKDLSSFDDDYHERVTELLKERSVALSEAGADVLAPMPGHDHAPPVKP